MGFKETLKMVALIASAVVALGGAVTYVVTTWTDYGWVTKAQFAAVSESHLTAEQALAMIELHRTDEAHVLTSEESDEKLDRILVSTLRDEILEYQKFLCMNPNDPVYQEALEGALEMYAEAAGRPFPREQLDCERLLQ